MQWLIKKIYIATIICLCDVNFTAVIYFRFFNTDLYVCYNSLSNLGVCPRLTDPDNGFLVIMTGVSEGDVASFYCNFGYELVDSEATKLTCRNGQWSAPPPVCESFGMRAYLWYHTVEASTIDNE